MFLKCFLAFGPFFLTLRRPTPACTRPRSTQPLRAATTRNFAEPIRPHTLRCRAASRHASVRGGGGLYANQAADPAWPRQCSSRQRPWWLRVLRATTPRCHAAGPILYAPPSRRSNVAAPPKPPTPRSSTRRRKPRCRAADHPRSSITHFPPRARPSPIDAADAACFPRG